MIPTKREMKEALIRRQGKALTKQFEKAVVAVCGLGGLGSHIAEALARAGVGTLILLDFDRVDVSNLHRQQYRVAQVGRYKAEALAENIRAFAPYIEIHAHVARLTETNGADFLHGADVVCEAFDDPRAKAMLAELVLGTMPKTCLVAASGMAGFDSVNRIHTRKVMERFYLCGDEVSEVTEENGLFSSRVMVCAAHQAHMVLRLLAGNRDC